MPVISGTNGSSTLYIVRHAECLNNTTRILLKPDEDLLTDTGKQQAGLLGEYLADEKFTAAYCSDYARTFQTAQIILSKSNNAANLELKKDKRLRERYLGTFEGGPLKDLLSAFSQHLQTTKHFTEFQGIGVETAETLFGRIEAFLEEIFNKIDESETPQTILAVTHALTVVFLAHFLKHRSSDQFILKNSTDIIHKLIPNTGFIKLEIERRPAPGQPRILTVLAEHENAHLKPMKKADVLHSYSQTPEAKAFSGCVHQ